MAEEARCPSCDFPKRERNTICPNCGADPLDPAPDQGERDGLAERLEARESEERKHAKKCRPFSERANIGFARAAAFREAAEMAADEIRRLRTSTEGPTRVDPKLVSRIGGLSVQSGRFWAHERRWLAEAARLLGELTISGTLVPTRDESSTEGGAVIEAADELYTAAWNYRHAYAPRDYVDALDKAGSNYRGVRDNYDAKSAPRPIHPAAHQPAQSEGAGEARVNVDDLAQLEDGWDSYNGRKPTEAALATARHTQIVPISDGGLQMEWHIAGINCEVEIQPSGRITGFYLEPAPTADTPTEEEGA